MSAPDAPDTPMLVVDGLDVTFQVGSERIRAVRGVSFTLARGECLAIVGESGSGKSVTARTLIGLTGGRSTVSARQLSFDGEDLTALTGPQWQAIRGRRIGLVLQDALVSLDPLRTVGAEVAEPLRIHRIVNRAEVGERVMSKLADVGVPDPQWRARQYPHQLSGGLRQRALIASAIAAGPELLLADEPTTALDVTVAAQVLNLLRQLKHGGMSLLLISHDLAVMAGLADRIAVMYSGLIVEQGPAERVLGNPRHPYTRALLAAVPAMHAKGTWLSVSVPDQPPAGPGGCPYAARCRLADQRCRDELPTPAKIEATHDALCWHPVAEPAETPERLSIAQAPEPAAPGDILIEVEGVSKRFRSPDGTWHEAVRDVSFQLRVGEALGVVGESGSGKTTVARIVLGLLEPDEGTVRFAGQPWNAAKDRKAMADGTRAANRSGRRIRERDRRRHRRRIQAIYQDPLGSFDPRYTVERIVGEAVIDIRRGRDRRARVVELLDQVGLPANLLRRRPLELSGGQRQRVAIARALAPSPDVIVCDEPVSALDVSIQAQILDLLTVLQRDLGVALLFISHDLGVIHHVSDRLLVMKDGRVVETGDLSQVFSQPVHAYTQKLLAAIPRPDKTDEPVHRASVRWERAGNLCATPSGPQVPTSPPGSDIGNLITRSSNVMRN
ncbi:ABC transporter ATP-binding protein [Frankia sp. Cppng1_Ct_nod]|uniref:dipeptide ABC transporter ATP-binding protein n=1 Tax=Frankia sp. Cppng1_Ct_nod TaxID=2897162 RepID=UPI001041B6E2|nr:ABC transporter ATP-binding protein [Frankia sp. Cppng1_Ct_nod]